MESLAGIRMKGRTIRLRKVKFEGPVGHLARDTQETGRQASAALGRSQDQREGFENLTYHSGSKMVKSGRDYSE